MNISALRFLGTQSTFRSLALRSSTHGTELKGAPGWEAILVQREVPAGAESGKHTQGGNEIVYIQEGSVTLEVKGKPPVTLKAGEAFTTSAGEVHNVKNASKTAPVKALAFYVAKKGSRMEDIAVPTK